MRRVLVGTALILASAMPGQANTFFEGLQRWSTFITNEGDGCTTIANYAGTILGIGADIKGNGWVNFVVPGFSIPPGQYPITTQIAGLPRVTTQAQIFTGPNGGSIVQGSYTFNEDAYRKLAYAPWLDVTIGSYHNRFNLVDTQYAMPSLVRCVASLKVNPYAGSVNPYAGSSEKANPYADSKKASPNNKPTNLNPFTPL